MADHERKTRARSNDENDGRLLRRRAGQQRRDRASTRVAEATLEAAERRAQALDAKTRELLRALDAIEERRRVERRAREENDKAYDEDAAALGASARGRPALLADLRRVERERDARRAEAARVRDAQGTRREDPARFVSRALARYVFLKRDALVAEDEDDDERRARAAIRARRARREGAVRRVVRVRGYGASGELSRGTTKPVSRSAPGRFESAAAARARVRPRRAPRDAETAPTSRVRGVGEPRDRNRNRTETETETERGGEARGEGGAFARRRPGDGDDVYDASARRARDAAPPPRGSNSTRGLVGMPMLTKAKDLPPIPSVAARWGARRPF